MFLFVGNNNQQTQNIQYLLFYFFVHSNSFSKIYLSRVDKMRYSIYNNIKEATVGQVTRQEHAETGIAHLCAFLIL